MTDKTHIERPKCELRVRELADYMAASQQRKRSVLRGFKYRPVARTLQHKDARAIISSWLRDGHGDTSTLAAAAERMRARLATTDFESQQNEHNADYIETFMSAFPLMDIPACEMSDPTGKSRINLGGTDVVYNPDIVVKRVTVRNTRKIGGVFLRYAKRKELPEEAAQFQSSFTFGFLKGNPFEPEAEPEKKLCITIDGYSGRTTEAPGNAVYLFNEMEAACTDIAALWPAIQPPPNAVL